MTSSSAPLFSVTVTPVLPGNGTLEISNLSAADGDGQPFAGLSVHNGTFLITGSADVHIEDPEPPAAALPGYPFSTSWKLHNEGFGEASLPLITTLVISRDHVLDPNNWQTPEPDPEICRYSETDALPGFSTVTRTLDDCRIGENVRPGSYTGFIRPLM